MFSHKKLEFADIYTPYKEELKILYKIKKIKFLIQATYQQD